MSASWRRVLPPVLLALTAGCASTTSSTTSPPISTGSPLSSDAVTQALNDLNQPLTWTDTGTASAQLPALQHLPAFTAPTINIPPPVTPPLPLPGAHNQDHTAPSLPTLTVPTGAAQLRQALPTRLAGGVNWTGNSQDGHEQASTSSGQHLRRDPQGTTYLQTGNGWTAYPPSPVLAPYMLDPLAARTLLSHTTATATTADTVTLTLDPTGLPEDGQLSQAAGSSLTLHFTSHHLTAVTLVAHGDAADRTAAPWTATTHLELRPAPRTAPITTHFDTLTSDPRLPAATVLAPLSYR